MNLNSRLRSRSTSWFTLKGCYTDFVLHFREDGWGLIGKPTTTNCQRRAIILIFGPLYLIVQLFAQADQY